MTSSLHPLLLSLSICFALNAQPSIVDVVNSASHIPTGFPSAGIAQGSLFAIIGSGLGPDPIQFATFPLPARDGLAGVSVQVAVGGSTVDAIMVFAAPTQVSAILPSSTPTGTGVVTLNNNGAIATAPVVIVASAPGSFSLSNAIGLDGAGSAPGLAFNINGDGSTLLNLVTQPAQPGQTVMLAATGVGAITSDETQSGVTDAPSAQLQVFVGNVPATNVSVARGTYPAVPDGIDVSTVPQGIAAIDLVQFTVPDGVFGCIVSVVMQSGSFVSNPVTIAISPDGSRCVDPTAVVPGDTVTFNGTARVANIALTRTVTRTVSGGTSSELGIDQGQASFIQYDIKSPDPVTALVSAYSTAQNIDAGSCNMQWIRAIIGSGTGTPTPPPTGTPQVVTYLDAGPALNLKGPNGTMQIKQGKNGFYTGSFGTALTIASLPPSGKLFLDPGDYTADDGTGGVGVGPFTANLSLSKPQLAFADIDAINTVDRTKGVTVHWTGGDPNGFVTIVGTSSALSGTTPGSTNLLGSFQCSERATAGQFTVPAYITAGLPKTGLPQGLGGNGSIGVQTYVAKRFAIPSFDLGLITFAVSIGRSMVYQ